MTQTVPGVGLTPLIQEEYDAKLQALQELITGARNTTFENLHEAGSASLPITRGVVEALRDEPDQDILARRLRSEEHTSELQSLMRISYAVFCLKQTNQSHILH